MLYKPLRVSNRYLTPRSKLYLHIIKKFINIYRNVVQLILPSVCASCKQELYQHALLCQTCNSKTQRAKYIYITNYNTSIPEQTTRWRPSTASINTQAIFKYSNTSKNIIIGIKKFSINSVHFHLATLLADKISNLNVPQINLVPVPSNYFISNTREKYHIKHICQITASLLKNAQVLDVLKLKPYFMPYVFPYSLEEKLNLKLNNICVSSHIPNTNIPTVIVDDVLTTGSTMKACYCKLKAIREIYCFAFLVP